MCHLPEEDYKYMRDKIYLVFGILTFVMGEHLLRFCGIGKTLFTFMGQILLTERFEVCGVLEANLRLK